MYAALIGAPRTGFDPSVSKHDQPKHMTNGKEVEDMGGQPRGAGNEDGSVRQP